MSEPCVGLTVGGNVCGRKLTREFGELGWRCHHHAEGRWPKREVPLPATEKTSPVLPDYDPPPINSAPKTMKDARKLSSWVAWQCSLGKMDKEQGKAIIAAIREFRSALGDEKLKNQLEKAVRTQKEIKKRQDKETDSDEEATD